MLRREDIDEGRLGGRLLPPQFLSFQGRCYTGAASTVDSRAACRSKALLADRSGHSSRRSASCADRNGHSCDERIHHPRVPALHRSTQHSKLKVYRHRSHATVDMPVAVSETLEQFQSRLATDLAQIATAPLARICRFAETTWIDFREVKTADAAIVSPECALRVAVGECLNVVPCRLVLMDVEPVFFARTSQIKQLARRELAGN